MRPRLLLARAAAPILVAAIACTHTHRVGEAEPAGGDRAGETATPRSKPLRPHPGHPAVAPTPEGLMAPGSVRQIQEALRSRGLLEHMSGTLDEPTSAALRRFQESQDLPATGAPDRETLRKLGVSPEQVYRNVPEGQEQAPRPGQ